jgi:fumarate reductase flavoprotein subunit
MNPELTIQHAPLESDIVVIGGGGSGLAAALAAAEKGIKSIRVLENRAATGGNTAWATGLFGCESPTQARDKIIADRDELFKKAMEWAHWSRVDPRIIRAFLNKSGDTIRWLEEKGLEFNVIAFFPNQNPRVEHVPKGKGAHLTQVLAQQCREAGVEIILNCCGEKLLRDTNGFISGVMAVTQEKSFEIRAKSVIIASGGFGANKALLNKLCPQYYEDMPLRGLPLMGDGIRMAGEAGVAIDSFVPLLKEGPRIDANSWPLGGLERDPLTVWVNLAGQRFTDEAIGAHPFESVNAVLKQPGRVCFTLVDSSVKQIIGEKVQGLDKLLQTEVAKNRVKIADSWPEIAEWIGTDPSVLLSSVEEFNEFCEKGYDALFAKERRYLRPLRVAPFYAIRGYPHFLDTLGGIKVNEKMEALTENNGPLPGLFAAGVTTGGWESESYCSDLNGSAFGYAINSGRIAGESAARFVRRMTH